MNLINRFPDATKKDRVMKVSYLGPDCPSFTKRFFRELGLTLLFCFKAAILFVVVLFLLSALVACGVKRYDV